MATSLIITPTPTSHSAAPRGDWLGLVVAAALPLTLFGLVSGCVELLGALPLFFAPFGLPGWMGAVLHLAGLPLYGVAFRLVARQGQAGRRAGWWILALILATIAFPFAVNPLDSLVLAMLTMGLLLLGLATLGRVVPVSRKAALLMAPGLLWMGVSAFVGLSFTASWTPPFAPVNASQAA